MRRQTIRIRIDPGGALEIVDPGYDVLALLREVDPDYEVTTAGLDDPAAPRFVGLLTAGSGVAAASMQEMTESALWEAHARSMATYRDGDVTSKTEGELSLLGLKHELARRCLRDCRLCARRCGVDRLAGKTGPCGLGAGARVAEHFVHIAEEAPLNPSLVLNLRGCGLRCRYCQQHAILDADGEGMPLDQRLWAALDLTGARSLSFVGGNPDESLPAVLDFLSAAPAEFKLPVVWNHHAYMTPEVFALLEGVVDLYLPDFKYGSDACGQALSGVRGYVQAAHTILQCMMLLRDCSIIVRILVLPGHVDCCHRPAIAWLAEQPRRAKLMVSVRGQYMPDFRIGERNGERDGELNRRASRAEIETVMRLVADYGLTAI